MEKKTIIIHGTEHPFQGLQKLLGGFCHPKKGDNSDEDTITEGTHISEPDLTSQVHPEQQGEQDHHQQPEEEEDQHEIVVSQSRAAVLQPDTTCEDGEEDEGEEVTLHEATKLSDCEKQPEIIATSLNRSKRVTRGLGVALVAILAVLATLFTIHKLGYDLADIKFTSSDSSEKFASKPLIQIQYNIDKRIMATEPIPSPPTAHDGDIEDEPETVEGSSNEVEIVNEELDELKTDRVNEELYELKTDRVNEKLEELRTDRVYEKLEELRAIVADIQNDSEL